MDFDLEQITQFQERSGVDCHVLVWISPRNRNTSQIESLGFWTGDDHQTFLIAGTNRVYFGAGAVIQVPPIHAAIGLDVRVHNVILPPLLDEVRNALRIYEPRKAPIEVHLQPFSITTGAPLSDPIRAIKGFLDTAPEALEEEGAQVDLEIVSTADTLTRGRPLLRSNTALKARNPLDRGREYSDVSGEWVVPWGEK